jgi:quercetin dioxygenase-like cupin family protein
MATPASNSPTSWLLADEAAAARTQALQDGGRATRMLLKTPEVRVAVVAMAKGTAWPEHTAKGRVVVKVEDGRIEMRTAHTTTDLTAGMMVALEAGESHDVLAVEETVFLLIVAG